MIEVMDLNRRSFLKGVRVTAAVGELAFASQSLARSPQKSFGVVKQVNAGLLDVCYADLGPAKGPGVILLHGWPCDIHSYIDVAPKLAVGGFRFIVPYLRGYGSTCFLSTDTARNAQQAATGSDVVDLKNALGLERAVLAGFDRGARTVAAVAALWPERCNALVSVSGYLITNIELNKQPLPPASELGWWYQYYFATERGRGGYEKNRREFAKLIWKIASPKWGFDEATFERSAAAFDNPDHVSTVREWGTTCRRKRQRHSPPRLSGRAGTDMNESLIRMRPLAVLAHELRNPIGAIRNAVSLLESAGHLPGAMDQARRLIARQAGQMSVLVEDLLDLASFAHGTLTLRRAWIDVVPEVEAAVESCAWALNESGHSLCIDVPDAPLYAYIDGARTRQVITNLLDNACKYTPSFGRIQLSLEHDGDWLVFTVKDNGVGIASDRLPFVFDLFTREDGDQESTTRGLGVGLSLVREIAELHGGDVRVQSRGAGRGSEFTVRLPVSHARSV